MDTSMVQARPCQNRLINIDIIRGIAVLGILLMNIQTFAFIEGAYGNPMAMGAPSQSSLFAYYFTHLFADQKFMTIFSILFGVGIALMADTNSHDENFARQIHYRRMKTLMLLGLAHLIFFWLGDILFCYAISGMIAFKFLNSSVKKLVSYSIIFLLVCFVLEQLIGAALQLFTQEELKDIQKIWSPTVAEMQAEKARALSSWTEQFFYRLSQLFDVLFGILLYVMRVVGLMCLGIVLYKTKFFTQSIKMTRLLIICVVSLTIGLVLTSYGMQQNFAQGWPAEMMISSVKYNYWGSIFSAMAYIGLLTIFCQLPIFTRTKQALANVGKLALTNYLSQTIICSLIFYGWGLGLFGSFDRLELIGVTVAIWIFQLSFSTIWLTQFRMGPFEWLWRSITYKSLQPIKIHKPLARQSL